MGDLRYALRMLLKQPGFTVPVILALALGIGVNTTIFGFVDGLLFRPLPIDRLEEVVRVSAVDPEREPDRLLQLSYPIYTDYRTGDVVRRVSPPTPTRTRCTSPSATASRSG